MVILNEIDPCKDFELDKRFILDSGGWNGVKPLVQEMIQQKRDACRCGTNCHRRFYLLKIKGGRYWIRDRG